MAVKQLNIEGIGLVDFQKRRGTRSVRIRISGQRVKVTMPQWVPYKAAMTYVLQQKSWILTHKKDVPLIEAGNTVGKYHTLQFVPTAAKTMSSRVMNESITVYMPGHLTPANPDVQQKLSKVIEKALLEQSEMLLPDRIGALARQHGFRFADLRFKRLKGRWGSCDRDKIITINTYLIQLPWQLIDYVLVHELVHTEHLNHSTSFWQRLENCLPNTKQLRRDIKAYSTDIVL